MPILKIPATGLATAEIDKSILANLNEILDKDLPKVDSLGAFPILPSSVFKEEEVKKIVDAKDELYNKAYLFYKTVENDFSWNDKIIREKLIELGINSSSLFNFYISGGAVAGIIGDYTYSDIDIYFYDMNVVQFWSWYFSTPTNMTRGILTTIKVDEDADDDYAASLSTNSNSGYKAVITKNSIVLSTRQWPNKYNLIMCWHGKPENVTLKTFDMRHCSAYYKFEPFATSNTLSISREIYDAIVQKKMYFNPLVSASPKRIKKYWQRGFEFGENWSYTITPPDSMGLGAATYRIAKNDSVHEKEYTINKAVEAFNKQH